MTMALETSPRLRAARATAQAADSRIAGSGRLPDPQVQLGFMNYSLPNLAPMEPLGMVQLQFMQMIPLGNRLHLARQIAHADADAASLRIDEAASEVRVQVAYAFHDLAAAQDAILIARKSLTLLRDAAATAEAMYRVGDGQQSDVLRAQVQIAKMAEDTLRMQAMSEAAQSRLNALSSMPQGTEIALILPRYPDSVPSLQWLDSVSSSSRAAVRVGESRVRLASSNERRAHSEIIPDLQLGVQLGRGRTGSMGGGNAEFMGSLMVGASVPIFARSRQFKMREESQAMRRMAEAELDEIRLETRSRMGEMHAELLRSRRLASLYRNSILPQAEAAAQSALSAYRNGSGSFMALLESRMTIYEFEQELVTLRSEEGKAWAELEMLTGVTLFDHESASNSTSGFDTTGVVQR